MLLGHHRRVFAIRRAKLSDLAAVLPRTLALNAHEDIAVDPVQLEGALRRLLDDESLGGVWLVERDEIAIGHAIVTFGYDLEFAGRDAYSPSVWIDEDSRGGGAGGAALPRRTRWRAARARCPRVAPPGEARESPRCGSTIAPASRHGATHDHDATAAEAASARSRPRATPSCLKPASRTVPTSVKPSRWWRRTLALVGQRDGRRRPSESRGGRARRGARCRAACRAPCRARHRRDRTCRSSHVQRYAARSRHTLAFA